MQTTYPKYPLRPGLPPLPPRIAQLPVDPRGYPVPWFVAWVDGEPEFRAADGRKFADAVRAGLCWVCGQATGKYRTFVIGPMCTITRTTAEPPSHKDCAVFSALACPFLTKPRMVRRENDLPEDIRNTAGHMFERNPGVCALWTVTKDFFTFWDGRGGVLIEVPEPESVEWYAEGRPATRAEVDESIRTGLPLLEEMAKLDGPRALNELTAKTLAARKWFPPDGGV